MSKISVLVPVYNVKKYLGVCLDSIIGQDYADFEVICIDDGSTDGSGMILDEYAARDDRFVVVHTNNYGYGSAMNTALKNAKGDYIAIVEPDDMVCPNILSGYLEDMEKYELDFVKSDFYMTWHHDDGTVENVYYRLSNKEGLYDKVLSPRETKELFFVEKFTWNGLYRKQFLIDNKIVYNETPGASYQDNGFWFQTMYYAKCVMLRSAAYYCYTRDNENASSWNRGKADAFKNEYDYLRQLLLQQDEKDIRLFQILFHWRIRGYISTLYRIDSSLREGFADLIQKECEYFDSIGESKYDWIPEEERDLIDQLREGLREPIKSINLREEALKEAIHLWKTVIVYGAGACGSAALQDLKKVCPEKKNIYVAVTNLGSEKKYCLSYRVREMKDFMNIKEEAFVILAVKKETDYYDEMKNYLICNGFSNVYEYSGK